MEIIPIDGSSQTFYDVTNGNRSSHNNILPGHKGEDIEYIVHGPTMPVFEAKVN